jgi:uncharacterized membrane protein
MKTIRFILSVLVIAAITHGALLYLGPSLIMSTAMGRMSAAAGGVNAILHAPRPTAANDSIVRSSPDLLYSVCVYDVSEKPLRIKGDVPPGTYWSASFYDMNTNNYRVINDAQVPSGAFVLVLSKPGAAPLESAGAEALASPTTRGLILFRTLVSSDARQSELDAARRETDCRPL